MNCCIKDRHSCEAELFGSKYTPGSNLRAGEVPAGYFWVCVYRCLSSGSSAKRLIGYPL